MHEHTDGAVVDEREKRRSESLIRFVRLSVTEVDLVKTQKGELSMTTRVPNPFERTK